VFGCGTLGEAMQVRGADVARTARRETLLDDFLKGANLLYRAVIEAT